MKRPTELARLAKAQRIISLSQKIGEIFVPCNWVGLGFLLWSFIVTSLPARLTGTLLIWIAFFLMIIDLMLILWVRRIIRQVKCDQTDDD